MNIDRTIQSIFFFSLSLPFLLLRGVESVKSFQVIRAADIETRDRPCIPPGTNSTQQLDRSFDYSRSSFQWKCLLAFSR